MLQAADGTPDPFGDPVRAVALADPGCRPHDVHQRREVTPVAVPDGAPPQHPCVGRSAHPAGDLRRDAGLADPGLTGDDHRPRLAVGDDVPEGGHEHREFLVAAGERGIVTVTGPGDVRRPQADQLVGRDGFALALELQRRQPPPGCHRGGGDHGVVPGVHGTDCRRVGQPGGGVDGVADHRVAQGRLDAGQHLAGVDPDPQAEMAPAPGFVGDQPADGLLHGGGCADGPLRVVLVRGRRAEHGHDAVAGEIVDPSADLGDIAGERGEYPVGDLADPLGVEILGPRGEVREVTEQDGDHPALGALVRTQAVFGLEGQPAVEAEAPAGDGGCAAARAAQGSGDGRCDHRRALRPGHGNSIEPACPVCGCCRYRVQSRDILARSDKCGALRTGSRLPAASISQPDEILCSC